LGIINGQKLASLWKKVAIFLEFKSAFKFFGYFNKEQLLVLKALASELVS